MRTSPCASATHDGSDNNNTWDDLSYNYSSTLNFCVKLFWNYDNIWIKNKTVLMIAATILTVLSKVYNVQVRRETPSSYRRRGVVPKSSGQSHFLFCICNNLFCIVLYTCFLSLMEVCVSRLCCGVTTFHTQHTYSFLYHVLSLLTMVFMNLPRCLLAVLWTKVQYMTAAASLGCNRLTLITFGRYNRSILRTQEEHPLRVFEASQSKVRLGQVVHARGNIWMVFGQNTSKQSQGVLHHPQRVFVDVFQ